VNFSKAVIRGWKCGKRGRIDSWGHDRWHAYSL